MGNIARGACREGQYSTRWSQVLYLPSRHALSATFLVVHERNRCFYWFIVLWLLLTHVLLWECTCISRCYLCSQLYCTVLYCTVLVSTIQAICQGHGCSDVLLNKVRRVDQLLPWWAPGLGTLCYPQLRILCKWFCSTGFIPRLFKQCWN